MNKGKMYKELYEIIENYLPDYQKQKIPKTLIDYFKNNMNDIYNFKIDSKIEKIEDIELLPETKAFLIELYNEYLASDDEKLIIEKYNELCYRKGKLFGKK